MNDQQFPSRRALREAEQNSQPATQESIPAPSVGSTPNLISPVPVASSPDVSAPVVSIPGASTPAKPAVGAPPISAPNPYMPAAVVPAPAAPINAAPPVAPIAGQIIYSPVVPAPKHAAPADVVPASVAPESIQPIQQTQTSVETPTPTEWTPQSIIQPTEQPSAPTPVVSRAYEPVLAEAEEPITSQVSLFTPSTNLTAEPQTASIIIENVDSLDNLSIAISETGEMLKTGSIELPSIVSTNTGEIATILEAAEVDDATTQDSISGYVSSIAPMRASGVVNTSGKIGIMPSRAAKGQGQLFAFATVAVLMVAIGGLVLAAFMLGFLK